MASTPSSALPIVLAHVPSPGELARALAEIGSDLGSRYELLGYLGSGAYATVWQARDRVTQELVAVKRFGSRLGRPRSFYRELSAMFRMQHPRIVRLINLLEAPGGTRYLILEYCAGGSLRGALRQAQQAGQTFPLERAALLLRQLAEGLVEAHRLGLAHRDLKPENILFDRPAADPFGGAAGLKLADFGLARAFQHVGLAGTGAALTGVSGTPIYMAPEQFSGSYAAASDLYAVGVMLYEMLHGRPPFLGAPAELAQQHLRQTPAIAEELPAVWRSLLNCLLQKAPAQRPTAGDLLAQVPAVTPEYTTPRSCAATSQDLPASTFALFPEPAAANSGFWAVAADGVFHVSSEGRLDRFLPLAEIRHAEQDADGRLWLLQRRQVTRLSTKGSATAVLQLSGDGIALVPQGVQRLAVLVGSALTEFDLDQTPQERWTRSVLPSGLRPFLARLPDGRLVYSAGPRQPCLTIVGQSGATQDRLPLPGPCWGLYRWPAAQGLAVVVLGSTGLMLCRLDLEHRSVEPLEALCELLGIQTTLQGELLGLRSNGALVCWQPSGDCEERGRLALRPSPVRALAVAAEQCAILYRNAERCELQFTAIPMKASTAHA